MLMFVKVGTAIPVRGSASCPQGLWDCYGFHLFGTSGHWYGATELPTQKNYGKPLISWTTSEQDGLVIEVKDAAATVAFIRSLHESEGAD